jgi:hypothetical protein
MVSTQGNSVRPFRPARRSGWPRCRLGPALRSTSSSKLEATHGDRVHEVHISPCRCFQFDRGACRRLPALVFAGVNPGDKVANYVAGRGDHAADEGFPCCTDGQECETDVDVDVPLGHSLAPPASAATVKMMVSGCGRAISAVARIAPCTIVQDPPCRLFLTFRLTDGLRRI